MTHPSEQELILHYYGELQKADVAAHLQTCLPCQKQLQALKKDLDAFSEWDIPEKSPHYGKEVWADLQPKLAEASHTAPTPSKLIWLWLPAIAAIILVALFVGRQGPNTAPWTLHQDAKPNPVLNGRIAHHIEASAKMLAQVNSDSPKQSEQETTENSLRWLLRDNRLYRQALSANQDGKSKEVLEDLEFLLLRLNHANSGPDLPADLAQDVKILLPKLREFMESLERHPAPPNDHVSQF